MPGCFESRLAASNEVDDQPADQAADEAGDFTRTAIRHVPADWLELLRGTVIVAAHILAEQGRPLSIAGARLKSLFPVPPLVGSQVLGDGEIWTDFQVGPDGFSKFLVRDVGLRESQMGRLLQRICEIENYLMMALLALPLARDGLLEAGVDACEIDTLLEVIAARVASRQTGARWQQRALTVLERDQPRREALSAMLERYVRCADTGEPVHLWPLP